MVDTSFSQTLSQQQKLAPQMQQSLQFLQAPTQELQTLIQQELAQNPVLEVETEELSLLWFQEDGNELTLDAHPRTFAKNELLCLTEFHHLEVTKLGAFRLLRFNKPFYCIIDHDSEVGCKGILYYGSAAVPMIRPKGLALETLQTVWRLLELETLDEQLALLFNQPMALQQQLLIDTLKQEAEIEPLVAGMIGAWFSGDDGLFMEMFEAQSGDSELTRQFTEQLLDHRNLGMADKIQDYLAAGDPAAPRTYFVLVGAAHLI